MAQGRRDLPLAYHRAAQQHGDHLCAHERGGQCTRKQPRPPPRVRASSSCAMTRAAPFTSSIPARTNFKPPTANPLLHEKPHRLLPHCLSLLRRRAYAKRVRGNAADGVNADIRCALLPPRQACARSSPPPPARSNRPPLPSGVIDTTKIRASATSSGSRQVVFDGPTADTEKFRKPRHHRQPRPVGARAAHTPA